MECCGMTEKTFKTHTVRLVLGDQLNPAHSWFASHDPEVLYVMMEVRQETDYVCHHAQKVIAIFAAMRAFAAALVEQGHRVHYVRIDQPESHLSMGEILDRIMEDTGASVLEYQEPDEFRLDVLLKAHMVHAEASGNYAGRMVSREHFYTGRHQAQSMFKPGVRWLMETFYRQMRKRHAVLLDAKQEPEGGQWNFDSENRKAWKGVPPEPADFRPLHDHSVLWQQIQQAGVQTFGNPSAADFRWPVNRREALAQLETFVTGVLPYFGDFQDALSSKARRLFHSLLSFALNTKMLSPHEVVERVARAWREGHAPLPAAEGYIRQILGWREYVRGVYWATMPGYESHNFFDHQADLPDWFWTGKTGMACVSAAITQSLDMAHAHHIQRLMVIGNFALLAGLNPHALHQWYLGIYIDAFEWVELPNTVGMSQFADGGGLATKPYVSSAAYLDRMGDHCRDCRYDKKQKTGDSACPFNALYWEFYERHHTRLAHNPRIGMAYRQLEKMQPDVKDALMEKARALRADLNAL
jgi:deoxyribodipyrimidine photolyase-related protein